MSIPFRIQRVGITDSTNNAAKLAAEQGEPHGLVIVAEQQMAGRGRDGRSWVSPPGNLYCSIFLRPSIPPFDYGYFSFIAALATYDAISQFVDTKNLALKWPNDVLLDQKKIAGILLECDTQAGWLVIGVGVNVAHAPDGAACLGEVDVESVLQCILQKLAVWQTIIEQQGFSPIRTAWLQRSLPLNMPVTARLPNHTVAGIGRDLDDQGRFVLELPNGEILRISAGDVFFG